MIEDKEDSSTADSVNKLDKTKDQNKIYAGLDFLLSPTSIFHCYLIIITCTIIGNITRFGILHLSNYSYSFIAPKNTLWPNFVSCLIMGMCQTLNSKEIGWFTECPYLFTGITVGFCGSLSSYSSMMLEVFLFSTSLNLVNIKYNSKLPNRAYGIMEFLSVLLSQMFVSLGAYLFGRAFASDIIVKFIDICVKRKSSSSFSSSSSPEGSVESISYRTLRKYIKFVDFLLAGLAIPLIILFVVLASVYDNVSRSDWTLGPIFGIFGTFARYYISLFFNPLSKKFYYGTFMCNEFAVLTLGFFTLVQRGYNSSLTGPIVSRINACRIVSSLAGGFCGSLSTISTFINEGYNMDLAHALNYYIITIALSYILLVITLGAFSWSRGLTESIC